MTQFRILVTIVLLSFTSTTFATTVSGEAKLLKTTNKPTGVVSVVKKPISKAIVRKYTKIVSYMSPAGKELISFSITTKDGIIINAIAIPKATNKISKSLQTSFSKNLLKGVVGKKTGTLSINAIGGASLTTASFVQFAKKAI